MIHKQGRGGAVAGVRLLGATRKALLAILLASLLFGALSPAAARFVGSVNKLYVDFQKLSTDPADTSKYFVYAMIRPRCNRCPKTYFIMSETNNKVSYFGAFRCDKSFVILPQSSNGMRDILCKNFRDRTGAEVARFLRFDSGSASYK